MTLAYRALGISLLLGNTAACLPAASDPGDEPQAHGPSEEPSLPADGDDPLDIDAFAGTPIDGCNATGWSAATATLTLTLAGDAAVISAASGKVTVNGTACTGTVGGVAGTPLAITTVAKIIVNGTSGNDKVVLDLGQGAFGTRIFGATGGVTLNMGAGNDDVMVSGTTANDLYRAAKSSTLGDIFLELSNDRIADVKVVYTGSLLTTFSLGAGNDTVTGMPLPIDVSRFASGAVVSVPLVTAMVVYGGGGNDILTGGLGDDSLSGGEGDDIFRMAVTDDGGDTYLGDAGVDFVDYSFRTAALTIDVGPENPAVVGSVNLATLAYGAGGDIDGLTLKVNVDGSGEDVVTFADPMGPADVVNQINSQVGLTVAYLSGKNQLALMTPTSLAADGTLAVTTGTANALLGLTNNTLADALADADDGLLAEGDDVRATIENISGGAGNDVIFGGSLRNIIKGGLGDDTLGGGGSTTFDSALVADSLQGEGGADTFVLSRVNKFAVIAGGLGIDTVDCSGRGQSIHLSNDGVANDGESGESNLIGSDVEAMVAGTGDDTLNGGAGNDILSGGAGEDTISGFAGDDKMNGGAGDDQLNGGVGSDTVDYGASSGDLVITLCLSLAASGAAGDCGAANDGDPLLEADQIANVEWVIGGSGDDHMTASTIGATFEGGAGNDTLNGGSSSDTLWGDAGNDVLVGGAGDDTLEGNLGDDTLAGGTGDGDICLVDAADVSHPATQCEL